MSNSYGEVLTLGIHHMVTLFGNRVGADVISRVTMRSWAFQVVLVVKNPPASAGDVRDAGSIPGSGRYPGGGHGNPRQYSCLENPMDRGAWQAIVHGVRKSWTRLK